MSVSAGKEGEWSVGGSPSVVGKTVSYSYEDTAEELGYAVLGADFTSAEAGQRTLTGSAELVYDPADAGQALLVPGTKIAMNLYPQGNTSGKPKVAFSALIISAGKEVEAQGLVKQSVKFRSDGDVTESTVSA